MQTTPFTDFDIISLTERQRKIVQLIQQGQRLNEEEALTLYEFPLGVLSMMANTLNESKNGNGVSYIRNFHLEPTNICSYHCRFCSYSREEGEEGAWELDFEEIEKTLQNSNPEAKEIHITGGAHPRRDLEYYGRLLELIKKLRPDLHIKAFSAVEIHAMSLKSGKDHAWVLSYLKEKGLNSLPGGGAEIFDADIRQKICPEKVDADGWINIHQCAHQLGLSSNATMLYGHIETYRHRIAHMSRLRDLQDLTSGFNAFIPLKYRSQNNQMKELGEVPLLEDLKNYAVARIFLDNIQHLKAYWPMLGSENAAISLNFGVDDLDGTIEDTTSIYAMAGVSASGALNTETLRKLIRDAGKTPHERDSLYQIL